MNIEYFDRIWHKNNDKGDIEHYWDKRADEFIKYSHSEKKEDKIIELVKFIKTIADLDSSSRVLDIGSGPGNYSIEFSKIVNSVTGIDISGKMIQHSRDWADKLKIKNIDFIKGLWDEIDINKDGFEKKFDLVFASMCPGINNKDTLYKMIKCSKKYCFLSTFVNKREYVVDPDTKDIIWSSEFNPHANKAYSVFNILWLKGYYPEITYKDNKLEKIDTCDKIITDFVYGKKNPILNILNKLNKDKKIKYIMESKVAWIFWQVN